MADLLMETGRLVWRELSLRSQVGLDAPRPPMAGTHTVGHQSFMAIEGLWAEEGEGMPKAAPKPQVQWRLSRPDLFPKGGRMEKRTLLYDERFLESYAGAIITDPATAIVKFVATCWDAYPNTL